MSSAFVVYEELSGSRRELSAEVDNSASICLILHILYIQPHSVIADYYYYYYYCYCCCCQ